MSPCIICGRPKAKEYRFTCSLACFREERLLRWLAEVQKLCAQRAGL